MVDSNVIDIQTIRKVIPFIMKSFEGVEIPDLGDDHVENLALCVSIVMYVKQLIQSNKEDYMLTSIDFIKKVKAPKSDENVMFQPLEMPAPDVLEDYISVIKEPCAKVASYVRANISENQDAYLLLSLLLFALIILLTQNYEEVSRKIICDILGESD